MVINVWIHENFRTMKSSEFHIGLALVKDSIPFSTFIKPAKFIYNSPLNECCFNLKNKYYLAGQIDIPRGASLDVTWYRTSFLITNGIKSFSFYEQNNNERSNILIGCSIDKDFYGFSTDLIGASAGKTCDKSFYISAIMIDIVGCQKYNQKAKFLAIKHFKSWIEETSKKMCEINKKCLHIVYC